MVVSRETEAEILRLYHVEKWPPGTIAAQLHIHHDVVRRVIERDGAAPARPQRPSRIDAYLPFILESLRRYERGRRSLERRIRAAKLGGFKSMADFDWEWPTSIDRDQIEDILQLSFLDEAANVVLLGPRGIGKTMLSQNIGYQALHEGHTVLRVTASEMLNDLASQESSAALARRLRRYCGPRVLLLDEVGYLSYDGRYGDLLFEVISRRYEVKSTVLTTNKVFSEWTQVFETASCVSALVDRIVHRAEIVLIDGRSYREKEARERNDRRAKERKAKAKKRRAS